MPDKFILTIKAGETRHNQGIKMERELTGKANHVFSEDEITSLDVHSLTPDDGRSSPFISIGDDNNSVLIHSIEQWEQLNALVRRSFDNMSG